MANEQPIELVIFGAGGHAKVVIETCIGTSFRPVVCLGQSRWTRLVGVDVEVEEQAEQWRARGVRHALVAIGNNAIRDRVAANALSMGFELATVVSPHAWVSPTARLGSGTVVMAGAVIQVEAAIGDCGIVNTGASIDHECVLGRAVHAAPALDALRQRDHGRPSMGRRRVHDHRRQTARRRCLRRSRRHGRLRHR